MYDALIVIIFFAFTQSTGAERLSALDENSKSLVVSQSQLVPSSQPNCEYLRGALRLSEEHQSVDKSQYDRETLEHLKAEFAKCLAWSKRAASKKGPTKDCASSKFSEIRVEHAGQPAHRVQIWRQREGGAFFFESALYVDADGAPNAYAPQNQGLDDLANAGEPGSWAGLADWQGIPFLQDSSDPFPGYYVSTTALVDQTKAMNDPARYVDASRIPYIVLPEELETKTGARLGDLAMVFNLQNGKSSAAIYADNGPPIGEGSIALAKNLELWPDARRGGTTRGIVYLVFPGSGNGKPRAIEEIATYTGNLFQAWGGAAQLIACDMQ